MTGAAGAIGGAVAEQLLRNGASVCICDIGGSAVQIMGGEKRDGAQALEERRDELAAATGGDVMSAVCDVTNLEQIEAMMAAVEERYGRLDILANVAGIGMPTDGRLPFREARLSDWEKVIDIDLTGPFRVTQAALPLLDKGVKLGGSARVINIASVAGVLPLQLQAAYSSAKSGLISLTQSMALELGKEGILVNAIAPGTIATEGTAGLWGKMEAAEDGSKVNFKTEEAGEAGAAHRTVSPCLALPCLALPCTLSSHITIITPAVFCLSASLLSAGQDSFAGRDDAQRHMDMIALGRPGVPNDIAQGILFLCASNYTNGHTLVIDGAWSICIRPF